MSGKELIAYLINPSLLGTDTVNDLREMLEEFPSFEVLRMLYVKNLLINKDIRYKSELKKAALLLSDRVLLYHLIYDEYRPVSCADSSTQQETGQDRTFSLIDTYIDSLPDWEKESEEVRELDHSFSIGVWDELEKEPEREDAKPMKGQELIDRFIENNETETKSTLLLPEEKEEEKVIPPFFEESLLSNESYFTETLAAIYVKQGRYERAMEIIRKLYLNYPEKSTYFAEQIRNLEELIVNDNKQR